MSSKQMTLEMVVEATLKGRGLKATKEEIENVTASIEAATVAGKELNTSADQIVATYEKLQKSAASTTSEWERMTDAQKQDQRESAQRAVRLLEADEAQKKAGKSAASLGQNLGVLKMAGAGASGVIGGILTGNLQQASQGLLTMSQAVDKAGAGLRTFFAQIARGGAIGAVIAGPALVALAALKQKTDEMAAENKKTQDDAGKAYSEYTALVEASAARQVAALAAVTAEIERQSEAMRKRDALVDAAESRADKVDPERRKLRDQQLDIDEKNALAKTNGNSAAQAKIKAEFRAKRERNEITDKLGGFVTEGNRAKGDIGRAQDDIRTAQQRNAEQDAAVAAAQREYDLAVEGMKAFKSGRSTGQFDWKDGVPELEDGMGPGAIEARKRALAARENLNKVKGTAATVAGENAKVIETAQKQIETAQVQLEVAKLQKEYYMRELAQKGKDGTAVEKRVIEEAKAAVEGKKEEKAGSGGTITKDGQTVGVVSEKTAKSAVAAAETMLKVFNAVNYMTDKVTIEGEKTRKKIERTSQAGPGGGG